MKIPNVQEFAQNNFSPRRAIRANDKVRANAINTTYSFKSRAASFVQNHDVVVIFNVFMLQLWVLTKVGSYFITLLAFPSLYYMLFFATEQKIPPVEQPLWTFRRFAERRGEYLSH
jgi:hypothetical protein